jgi:hypothetical protein
MDYVKSKRDSAISSVPLLGCCTMDLSVVCVGVCSLACFNESAVDSIAIPDFEATPSVKCVSQMNNRTHVTFVRENNATVSQDARGLLW